jgi:hypothetical protein
MANHESAKVIPQVLMEATAKGWRLFRNSVGQAWAGKASQGHNGDGERVAIIQAPHRITYGLAVGSSDLVGWRPVVITQDMVGKQLAQFVSIECKTRAYGKTTEEQDNWLDQVAGSGGAAYIARENADGGVDVIPIEA